MSLNPINPAVVARLDEPANPWAGIWIAEDIQLIAQGVASGSWIDGGLGAVSLALDGFALSSDPVGVLLQYGISWAIEHIEPLNQALDWLAGDPGAIAGQAATWSNVSTVLGSQTERIRASVEGRLGAWTGEAADRYMAWSGLQQSTLDALAKAAATMGEITRAAGGIVAFVRTLVRDAIATVLSRIITYAAEEILSGGLLTPLVVEQVGALCASWYARVARWLKGLVASLGRLAELAARLARLARELVTLLSRMDAKARAAVRGGVKPGRTMPTLPLNTPAKGAPPKVLGTMTDDQARSLKRQIESGDLLARYGFDVTHEPGARPNGKQPDYVIAGTFWDCYAPTRDSARNIATEIDKKVSKNQADRIVLSLEDTPVTADQMREQFRNWPIEGLKEVIAVKDGRYVWLWP